MNPDRAAYRPRTPEAEVGRRGDEPIAGHALRRPARRALSVALGGLLGGLLGAIGVTILGHAPAIRGLLKPEVTFGLLATAVAMSLAVGIFSGLYPAWRSSRLNPSRALQG